MKKHDFARVARGAGGLSQDDLNTLAKDLAQSQTEGPDAIEAARNILLNIEDIKYGFFLAASKNKQLSEFATQFIISNRGKDLESIIQSFEKHENEIFDIGSFDGYDQVIHEILARNNPVVSNQFLNSKSVVASTIAERQIAHALKLSSNSYDEGFVEAVFNGISIMKVPTSKSIYFIRERDVECHAKMKPYVKTFLDSVTEDVKGIKVVGNYSVKDRTFKVVKSLNGNQLAEILLGSEVIVGHDSLISDKVQGFLDTIFEDSGMIPKELILKKSVNGVRYSLNNSTLLDGISEKAEQHKAKIASLALLATLSVGFSPDARAEISEHERYASTIADVSRIDGSGNGSALADLIDGEIRELRKSLSTLVDPNGNLKRVLADDKNRELRTYFQVLENRMSELRGFSNDESITKLRGILANVERVSRTLKSKLSLEQEKSGVLLDIHLVAERAKDMTELLSNKRVFGSYTRAVKQ
ncbi:hypothetical protein [Bdellovibrio sp. BCCA]|uniref:hypothetical protein n=1 Tax=Bdellovibrio sp. BCCA TaxID=3136281 RepID=UPI0030F234B3